MTTDPTPTLARLVRDAQGRFAFGVSGIANEFYVVEASTNLVHWVGLETNSIPASAVWPFVDEDSLTIPYHFYRARYQP